MPEERGEIQEQEGQETKPVRRGLPIMVKILILLLLLAASVLATTVAGLAWPGRVENLPVVGKLFPPEPVVEQPSAQIIQENERALEEARLETRRQELEEARANLEALVAQKRISRTSSGYVRAPHQGPSKGKGYQGFDPSGGLQL